MRVYTEVSLFFIYQARKCSHYAHCFVCLQRHVRG